MLTSQIMLAVLAPIAGQVSDADITSAVERALPYIEERGVWWMEKKKCASCHRVGNMVWTLGAARSRGFEVSPKLDDWYAWVERDLVGDEENDKKPALSGNREGFAQLVLARDYFDLQLPVESHDKMMNLVVEKQRSDGAWDPGGQLPKQKRDTVETTAVTTSWIALAMAEMENQDYAKGLASANKHAIESQEGQSIEWYAVQLLLANSNGDERRTKDFRQKLMDLQKDDGSWGWIVADQGDGLATGIAAYALVKAGGDEAADAVGQAMKYLLSSQREDGTWSVKGTKKSKKNQEAETAVYWGTCWAILAMVESLPPEGANSADDT